MACVLCFAAGTLFGLFIAALLRVAGDEKR